MTEPLLHRSGTVSAYRLDADILARLDALCVENGTGWARASEFGPGWRRVAQRLGRLQDEGFVEGWQPDAAKGTLYRRRRV